MCLLGGWGRGGVSNEGYAKNDCEKNNNLAAILSVCVCMYVRAYTNDDDDDDVCVSARRSLVSCQVE